MEDETKVSQIMCREILTASPGISVKDIYNRMEDEGVGSILVEEGSEIVGIVSFFDMLRAIKSGEYKEGLSVEDVMTPKVVTIGEEETVKEAADKMVEAGIRRLPVVRKDGMEVIGMVDVSSVLRHTFL